MTVRPSSDSSAQQCAAVDLRELRHPHQRRLPGIIDTHMIERIFGDTLEGRQAVLDQEPIGRLGQPEEIAEAVSWMCSEASFAVGHAMAVHGGQTA